MIQFIVTKNCPECESDNIVKNGKDYKGDQKFHCHACGAYGTLDTTVWSFVYCKDNQRWVWIALCRRTRQIVAFYIGDRSEASCRELWNRIPTAYRGCHTFSDFWDAYQKVFATGKHHSVGKDSDETAHVE